MNKSYSRARIIGVTRQFMIAAMILTVNHLMLMQPVIAWESSGSSGDFGTGPRSPDYLAGQSRNWNASPNYQPSFHGRGGYGYAQPPWNNEWLRYSEPAYPSGWYDPFWWDYPYEWGGSYGWSGPYVWGAPAPYGRSDPYSRQEPGIGSTTYPGGGAYPDATRPYRKDGVETREGKCGGGKGNARCGSYENWDLRMSGGSAQKPTAKERSDKTSVSKKPALKPKPGGTSFPSLGKDGPGFMETVPDAAVVGGDSTVAYEVVYPENEGIDSSLPRVPYWNAWLGDAGSLEPIRSLDINTREHTKFNLDLSAYDFAEVLGEDVVASGEPEDELVSYIDDSEKNPMIVVRPFVSGAVYMTDTATEFLIEIDREKFKERGEEEETLYDDFKSKQIGFKEFSDKVRAIRIHNGSQDSNSPITINLRTGEKPGCGIVGLSIWDETGKKPLDHIVFRINVGRQSDAGWTCFENGEEYNFESGFKSVLRTATGRREILGKKIEASLYLFEFKETNTKTAAIAVYVDASNAQEQQVYSWALNIPLSNFMEEKFSILLDDAQKNAAKPEETATAYARVSNEIKERIFVLVENKDREQASAAWDSVKQLALTQSILVTRLVNDQGEMIYMPLGLLHAGGSKKALEGDLTIVQALPVERNITSCVDPWWYILPTALEKDTSKKIANANRDLTPSWLRKIFDRYDINLKQYLFAANEEEGGDSPAAEGLLAIAHQSKGWLWFDKEVDKFAWGDFKRKYAPGSVTVLAACEAAGIDYDNRKLLNQLNDHGVDLIIAAPFQVKTSFATQLTIKMDEMLRKYHREADGARDMSIVQIFKDASEQAASTFANKGYQDMKHEFVILGNHEIIICPSE